MMHGHEKSDFAIPIGTAIDCPICTNKTAIALIALGSASAGAVLGRAI
jgi:hypothetical protein